MNAGEVRRIMGADMDGRSLLPLLTGDARGTGHQRDWRSAVLIEHRFWTTNIKCVSGCRFDNKSLSVPGTFPAVDVWCANLSHRTACWQTPSRKPGWAPKPTVMLTVTRRKTRAILSRRYGKPTASCTPKAGGKTHPVPCGANSTLRPTSGRHRMLLADAELGGPHRGLAS